MDWELYERQRATLTFIGVAVISFLLLAFQRTSAVQHIKAFFVNCTSPTQRVFAHWATPPLPEKSVVAPASTPTEPGESAVPVPEVIEEHAEKFRALRVITEENTHLNALLGLKRERWPRMLAAHVVGRDPQRWFQEVLLDKGSNDGVHMDDAVIAISGKQEALVGRVVELGANTTKVMLISDSLSSVPASVVGVQEDGIVEGGNSHDLYLKYLIRDSQVKIGDQVVTSGLGNVFPPGIPLGWVQEIGLDQRQLFLQAKLRPASAAFPMRVVGILMRREER